MSTNTVWLNGSFLPFEDARISPLDRGFLFGEGLFETIRAEGKKALFLDLHLARLEVSARCLRIPLPAQDWDRIIRELLEQNDLRALGGVAKVKIVLTRETALILAEEASLPSEEDYCRGWNLGIEKELRTTPLACHKSLCYFPFLMARERAREADDAILLDPSGAVSETSRAALLVRLDGTWWSPESHYQLPSTTLAALSRSGLSFGRRKIRPEALQEAEGIWALNAMIGIMPVAQVNDRLYSLDPEEAQTWRRVLFGVRAP